MIEALWDVWVYQLVRLTGKSVCSKKVVEYFWEVHIFHVTVKGSVVDSNMDDFSGNMFAVLVYYHEVGDIGLGVVAGNAVFVKCTGSMTIVFFYSIFQASAGISYVRKVTFLF